jgi:hypothetical protein
MQVAFNYTESAIGEYIESSPNISFHAAIPLAVARVVPRHRRHCRIQLGTVPTSYVPEANRNNLGDAISMYPARWHSYLDLKAFRRAFISDDLCAVVLDGISAEDAVGIDEECRSSGIPGYLGAFQLLHGDVYHEVLYLMNLPAVYYIYADTLTLLVSPDAEQDGDYDTELMNELARILPSNGISTVRVQSYGVTGSVFDPYEANAKFAQTIGRVERVLSSYTEGIITEITLRARESDPRLLEVLDAALQLFKREEGRESMSQIALSCRRFLERLADVVYPANQDKTSGRKLGKEQYRNRLWAYVEAQLGPAGSDTALKEIGARIDLLDRIANKGVHGDIEIDEIHRLVLNLALLTHDLLKLTPPSRQPSDSYQRDQDSAIERMIAEAAIDPNQPK